MAFSFSVPALSDFKIDFTNTPLGSMVTTMSNVTGKSFTFASETGSVPISLTMSKDLSKQEVYLLFLNSLKVSGLKAVEQETGLVSIYPIESVTGQGNDYDNVSFQTVVMTLVNVRANDVSKSLEPSISKGGYVAPAGDFKLIIKDTPRQITLLKSLVYSLDHKPSNPVISRTVILNNILPSTLQERDGLELMAFDDFSRLVVRGKASLVNEYVEMANGLDLSVKSVYVRLLISSMGKDFSEDFNLMGVFQFGALSMNLQSLTLNTLSVASDGISALVSLLKTHSDVKIHSKPFLQVLEGKEASFNVGREIPIVVSSIDKDTGQTVRNIERKKIGLSITLNAKVRPDGLIHLDLNQNLSAISETQLTEASDIITDDQSLQTTLLLKPNNVYAVGGLSDSRSFSSKSSVPFFSIFDSDQDSSQEQEIIIFIEVSHEPFKKSLDGGSMVSQRPALSVSSSL